MIEMIFVFLGLHCLADYPLQGDFLARLKGSNWIIMSAHCAIWTFFIYIGLVAFKVHQPMWQLPFLFFGHMVIDKWKCSRSGNGQEIKRDLLIDQCLHFVQIAVCILVAQWL